MNGLSRHVQRRPFVRVAAKLAVFSAVFALSPAARAEGGQNQAELVAARELFRQATEDADAGRYDQALDRFKRVAQVKETANVRFNIARCEEALGKTGAALADFELAEREGNGDAKISGLAHDRADALRPKVPRLSVIAPSPAPDGLSVSLDGAKLSPATLGAALPIDPGNHLIEATAPAHAPFRAQLSLAASESKSVRIELADVVAPPPPPPPPPDEHPVAPPEASPNRTWGYVALAGGGVLAAGSVVFLLLHNSAVSDVKADCPGGRCPEAKRSDVESATSRAHLDEGLAIGLGAASAVALGVGVYLVVRKPSSDASTAQTTSPAAWIAPSARGVVVGGTF